jgi:hypothetical protein
MYVMHHNLMTIINKAALVVIMIALTILMNVIFMQTANATNDVRQEIIQFQKGANGTTIKSQIKGREIVDYLVEASAGQTISIVLKPDHPSNYFNLLPPESESAMFIGSTSGEKFKALLPADGKYTIRVYLMRSAARRNVKSRYTLSVHVNGKPFLATAASKDALIPGTPYHASTDIICTRTFEPEIKKCQAYVTRRGFDGTATIEIRWPDNTKRRILFVKNNPVASDAVEAITLTRRGDVNIVNTGQQEQFEIPDALIFGG